ncbi:hypothetical protein V8C86DRAFT_1691158, partial [Haematococcus lacustris]
SPDVRDQPCNPSPATRIPTPGISAPFLHFLLQAVPAHLYVHVRVAISAWCSLRVARPHGCLVAAMAVWPLQGTVDLATGQMELQFDANFVFSAGPLYTAPPLVVRTLLTTEDTQGSFRKATGQRIVGSIVKLVGTATVDKTGDLFLDNFLLLPTDALAIMSAELEFA